MILRAMLLTSLLGATAHAATLNGPLPTPLPLFPADNWWNLDVTSAPVDPGSAAFIAFVGLTRAMHPNLGGDVSPGSVECYGYPYAVVGGNQPKLAVQFFYSTQSDGVDHATDTSFPFYPIPAEAIAEAHWIEGGEPGTFDARRRHDRHLLIVDSDGRKLYELYDVWYDGVGWQAGAGACFDLDANDRRPDGWTSADAAGLAVLPGLIRYDEVFGVDEIRHAFRVTMRATNSYYVFPASHRQDNDPDALPMGARLRLKASVDISGFAPECQKIFRAMKAYGLIVADNGADMSVSGTYDNRWDNSVLNPCFDAMTAGDFDVIELGWNPPPPPAVTLLRDASMGRPLPAMSVVHALLPLDAVEDAYLPGIVSGDVDPESVVADPTKPLVLYQLTTTDVLTLSKTAGTVRLTF